MGCRIMRPAISKMTPRIASGAAAIEGIDTTLMACAKSDGLGAVVELAIKLNARIIPMRVTRKQANATVSDAIPDRTNHCVERVGGAVDVALLDS